LTDTENFFTSALLLPIDSAALSVVDANLFAPNLYKPMRDRSMITRTSDCSTAQRDRHGSVPIRRNPIRQNPIRQNPIRRNANPNPNP